jgi:outer membrane immunogenic protein
MRTVLKSLVLAVLAFGGPAVAADMPLKAPPMAPPVPVWTWTGFYGGFNVGGSVADNRHTHSLVTAAGLGVAAETFDSSIAGVIGGGQIGYNWAIDQSWLFGIETDFQGSSERRTDCTALCSPLLAATFEDRLDWFGTVRGRLGYVTGSALWYVTGGFAYGRVVLNATESPFLVGGLPGGVGVSSTQTGWTAGAGVETRLWNSNWTAKLEYLFVDLGTLSTTFPTFTPAGLPAATSAFETRTRDNIFRVGVNYKFGWYNY